MKYLESFKDIFISKSPAIIDKLSKTIFNFLKLIFFTKVFLEKSKGPIENFMSIFYDTSHQSGEQKIMGFYFNKNTRLLMIAFIYRNIETNDVLEFLFSKIEKFAMQKKNRTYEVYLWFKLEDISSIIKELNDSELKNEFDTYLVAKKYNL